MAARLLSIVETTIGLENSLGSELCFDIVPDLESAGRAPIGWNYKMAERARAAHCFCQLEDRFSNDFFIQIRANIVYS